MTSARKPEERAVGFRDFACTFDVYVNVIVPGNEADIEWLADDEAGTSEHRKKDLFGHSPEVAYLLEVFHLGSLLLVDWCEGEEVGLQWEADSVR